MKQAMSKRQGWSIALGLALGALALTGCASQSTPVQQDAGAAPRTLELAYQQTNVTAASRSTLGAGWTGSVKVVDDDTLRLMLSQGVACPSLPADMELSTDGEFRLSMKEQGTENGACIDVGAIIATDFRFDPADLESVDTVTVTDEQGTQTLKVER